jgi:tetratricopeptide (TPR) repeat protein
MPDNALSSRGAAYFGLGEYQKSINDYDQAITLNPKDDKFEYKFQFF